MIWSEHLSFSRRMLEHVENEYESTTDEQIKKTEKFARDKQRTVGCEGLR